MVQYELRKAEIRFKLRQQWIAWGNEEPEFNRTMARLQLLVDDTNLTKHENIWSQSVEESIVVSTYPLAMWFADNWWRLCYEPLPLETPTVDWRMAHEMGAVNHGFVWPHIVFITDGDRIQIFSKPSDEKCRQSACYLNGLSTPFSISIVDFQRILGQFISTVIDRLATTGVPHSELSELWHIVREERTSIEARNYRKLEAQMGFDADECPLDLMNYALGLDEKFGKPTVSELIPIYGKSNSRKSLKEIENFVEAPGIMGKPVLFNVTSYQKDNTLQPWQTAVQDAQAIRRTISDQYYDKIDNKVLLDLLGITKSNLEKFTETKTNCHASVAIHQGNGMKFVLRKQHKISTSKRFELARFIGDCLYTAEYMEQDKQAHWLTNTDLGTARQKYQRAFAAEFLSPINRLEDFLQKDFSNSAIKEAADYFEVSVLTVNSLLRSNNLIPFDKESYKWSSAYSKAA